MDTGTKIYQIPISPTEKGLEQFGAFVKKLHANSILVKIEQNQSTRNIRVILSNGSSISNPPGANITNIIEYALTISYSYLFENIATPSASEIKEVFKIPNIKSC